MPLNFSHKNLSGRSFKGRDLRGANFAHANIKGTNFAHANLKNADFNHAQAGQTLGWHVGLAIVTMFILGVAVFATWMAGAVTLETIFPAYSLNSHLPNVKSSVPAIFVLSTLALFYGVLLTQGFTKALITAGMITGGTVFCLGGLIALIYGGKGLEAIGTLFWQHIFNPTLPWARHTDLKILGTALWRAIAVLNWSLMSTAGAALTVVMTRFSPWTTLLIGFEVLVGARAIAFGLSLAPQVAPTSLFNAPTILLTFAIAFIFFAGIYSGAKALQEDDNYIGIRKMAIALFALKGTSFRGADLTDANFAQAQLKYTDFRNAIILRTNFHLGKFLDRARVGHTLLMDKTVRTLLVTHRGIKQVYVGANLRGANLAGADLRDADLTDADLSQATLAGCNLARSNLTRVQAVGTNFCHVCLTGACLETWNIDNATQLDGIECEFVYLLNGLQERRPSSSIFSPGEFTRLFQVAMHTIDLFFQHGIDWKAFALSLNQVQVENADTPLTIQSIENKGDGVVVIKVEAPTSANKAQLHRELTQAYEQTLNQLAQHYQAQLNSKDEQIALHQQHQADLRDLVHLLAGKIPVSAGTVAPTFPPGKRVVVKLEAGDFRTGFSVSLQIGNEGELPFCELSGRLEPAPDLLNSAHQWRSAYRQGLVGGRLEVPDTQITHRGRHDYFQDCVHAADQLKHHLNVWLNAESFRPLKEQLLEQLSPAEPIRFMVQTGDRQVQQLPFHLWDFFERYPKAELALSTPIYEQIERHRSAKSQVNILAILGDSTGIDVDCDRQILAQLPHAAVTFLVEPQRKVLNDQLWEQPWDILFFAGHSSSGNASADFPQAGYLKINPTEELSVLHLKHALRKAVECGLKLAILNSCDGLGLALDLASLHLPQIIVMREPVPDRVAQEFLKNFLTAFSGELSFYQSVREAREKLQGIEDEFPCATWLPSICQNPAEKPLTWGILKNT